MVHKKHNDYYEKLKKEHSLKLRKVKPTPPTDIELAIMAREDPKRINYLNHLRMLKDPVLRGDIEQKGDFSNR